jgi:hypothetical protein
MSADNGVILKKTKLKYIVIEYQGEYETTKISFDKLSEALKYIAENCNDTEYGITLKGFIDE